MSKILDRNGLGVAINEAQHDSNLSSLSGINEAITAATYNVSIDDQNRTLEISNATGCAVQLPAVSTITTALHTDDYKVCFKNIGAGDVTVGCGGGDTFDDTTVSKTVEQYEHLVLQTDSTGGKWNILDTSVNVVNAYNPPDFDVLFDRTSAQRILGFTDGTNNIYFYGENAGTNYDVGMFDAKNSRPVWNYDESANTFSITPPLSNTSSALTTPTLTSPVLNTGVSGTAIDTSVTTSTTKVPHSNAVKSYVDDKTKSISFNSAGTSVSASTGLTCAKVAIGQYRITHNIGSSTTYHVFPVINGVTDRIVRIGALSTNTCDVYTWDISGAVAVDQACHVLIHVY